MRYSVFNFCFLGIIESRLIITRDVARYAPYTFETDSLAVSFRFVVENVQVAYIGFLTGFFFLFRFFLFFHYTAPLQHFTVKFIYKIIYVHKLFQMSSSTSNRILPRNIRIDKNIKVNIPYASFTRRTEYATFLAE